MRTIHDHELGGEQHVIIEAAEPDLHYGGASHLYTIAVNAPRGVQWQIALPFQRGGIADVGVNGITNEALLAIVLDRLRAFQSGPFANEYNTRAIACVREALGHLHDRTRERQARGVEGKLEK
jgi:hypothetical protein